MHFSNGSKLKCKYENGVPVSQITHTQSEGKENYYEDFSVSFVG
jgi:hypothetical protein